MAKRKTGNPSKAAKVKKTKVQTKPASSMIESGKKAVLHVGCGPYSPTKLPAVFRGDEWQEVRLDIDPKVKPDIVASMLDMPMVETASMDGLFSSHNVEHLYPHQVAGALKEFARVLKPGGMVVITLPDLQAVAAYIAEGIFEEPLYSSPSGPISPIDILYGWRQAVANGNHFMAHKGGFTAKSLAQNLLNAGFANITVTRQWVDLWAVGYKLEASDPRRKKTVVLRNGKMEGPQKQKLPVWYERKLQIAANAEVKTDPLEGSPQIWKPLGLKKQGG